MRLKNKKKIKICERWQRDFWSIHSGKKREKGEDIHNVFQVEKLKRCDGYDRRARNRMYACHCISGNGTLSRGSAPGRLRTDYDPEHVMKNDANQSPAEPWTAY